MSIYKQYDREVDRIEADNDLSPEERQEALADLDEDMRGAEEEQYQDEREELDRRYGR